MNAIGFLRMEFAEEMDLDDDNKIEVYLNSLFENPSMRYCMEIT